MGSTLRWAARSSLIWVPLVTLTVFIAVVRTI